MKKNGFTLVEIIGVIVILSILMVIIIPNITKSSTSAKIQIYRTKMETIKNGAILYAQDNYRLFINRAEASSDGCYIEPKDGIDYRVCEVKIGDLVGKYVVPDREGEEAINKGYMEDPRDKSKSLDNDIIKIRINPRDRKITAESKDDEES